MNSLAVQSQKGQLIGKRQWYRSAQRSTCAATICPKALINALDLHPVSIHQRLPPVRGTVPVAAYYSFIDSESNWHLINTILHNNSYSIVYGVKIRTIWRP